MEDHLSLAIENAGAIELWDAGNLRTGLELGCIEVDDFLGSVLEWQEDGVCRERREVWVEFL